MNIKDEVVQEIMPASCGLFSIQLNLLTDVASPT